MHCNYAEQGQTLDAMCELAARLGFDGIEFRRRRDTPERSAEAYLDEVAAAVRRHRIRQVIFGGPGVDLMAGDRDARRREIDDAIRFYTAAARRFELAVCNVMAGTLATEGVDYYEFDRHGSMVATPEQWAAATEGFRELGDVAADLGLRFALETHNVYLHDLPGPTRRLIDAVGHDHVGANLDFGNIMLHPEGGTLAHAFDALEGRIFLLHLKNMLLIPRRRHHHWIGCRLGDGVINHREFLQRAKAQRYDGPIVIEAPQPGDREHFAKVDLAYLRRLMAELQ